MISRYVLDQPERAMQLTLTQLAAEVGTSVASISRYCNMLGYPNYRAFQIDLTASVSALNAPVSDLFCAGDDLHTVIRRVFALNRQGLADTEALLNHDRLVEVVHWILDAPRLYLVGIGGSGLVARTGALRLASLGITALAITDPYEGLLTLSSASEQDVVLGISHTGQSDLVLQLVDLAKRQGARTVCITNYADSPLARLSDVTLMTSFRERRINAAVSTSSIEQLCILDAIYFVLAHLQGSSAEERVLRIEQNADRILRTRS